MSEASGWLDMSRFPDHDPDTVLDGDQHDLLTSSLAVDDATLPDAVWEHMLAVVVGTEPTDPVDTDSPDETGADDTTSDADDTLWAADLDHSLVLDDHAAGVVDDPGHDLGHDASGADELHPGGEGGTP